MEEVRRAMLSDWLTQGPKVPEFEGAVLDFCWARYAVAVNSGTSALHVACLALGLGSGDSLWTSPNTFVASANCALYCGAQVDFVDIDPITYNMSVEQLEFKLKKALKSPKIVVPVHFAGQPCDMEAIRWLADKYGFFVVEDACHALGAVYKDSPTGSCFYSDVTIFSFHPVKIITTGEGGMATTNQPEISRKMQLFRSHGITRQEQEMERQDEGAWFYEQQMLGYNYRMTDIQAAIGVSQVKRLNEFVEKRRAIAERYSEMLDGLPLQLPCEAPGRSSAWHLYVIRLDLKQIAKTRKAIFDAMRRLGVGVNVHYIPVHLQPFYQKLGFRKGAFPEAESYYEEALSLPIYPDLTLEQQSTVVRALKETLL